LMARADRAMYEDKRRKPTREVLPSTFARPQIEAVA
jgi:hypothetical protein